MASPQSAADPAPTDATKADDSKLDQFFRDSMPEDQEEAEKKKWLNKERVRAVRRAFLIFMIEKGLPQDQRWMWYTLMVFFHEVLDPPLYVYSIIPMALLWYFPPDQCNHCFRYNRRGRWFQAKQVQKQPRYGSGVWAYEYVLGAFVAYEPLHQP
jgi:hypothetical protein